MIDHDEVCVLVPTYNEAATIADVVSRFREAGFENVLVVDGGSDDGTQELAADAGAEVRLQSGTGKGQAVREGVTLISEPHVLLVDGDSTYRPEEAERLVRPLFAGEAEHVIGNRFANMQAGAMTRLNQFGNRIINRVFRFVHGRDLQDILSGYRAFTRESFEGLSLSAEGFGIETEMAVECVRHKVPTQVVAITYEPRPEESETNLRPLRDGGTIVLTLYRMAKTNNPLFYFGSFGVSSAIVGLILSAYVLYKWFAFGISHEVIALASGVALLFGLQLVMFGVLSDLILTSNREQSRRIDRLSEQIGADTGGALSAQQLDGESRTAESSDGESRTAESSDGESRTAETSDGESDASTDSDHAGSETRPREVEPSEES